MRIMLFFALLASMIIMIATSSYSSISWDSPELMPCSPLETYGDRPLFGVIRWDAFSGGDNTTNPELKSLSSIKYHSRVPFFLKIESDNKISGCENDQRIIDRQIAYARSAGINYWAFVTGPNMDSDGDEYYALHKFLNSKHKAGLEFCVILHKYDDQWKRRISKLVQLFKEDSYQKVMGNRPLVYIFSFTTMEKQYGTETKSNIEMLSRETMAEGLGRPYIVLMGSASSADKVREYKLDALSSYSGAGAQGTTYVSLAKSDVAKWEAYSKTGVKTIPLVSTGWNQMPRVDNPPPWGAVADGKIANFDMPKPDELAAHIKEGLSFVLGHRDTCEANSILVFAWNEFCEGGWLCPTYGDGVKRLEAIRLMMELYNKQK